MAIEILGRSSVAEEAEEEAERRVIEIEETNVCREMAAALESAKTPKKKRIHGVDDGAD